MFDISGKKAVVTGAAGGLGRGMAEALLEAGAEIAALDISPDLVRTAEELSHKGKLHAISADLSGAQGRAESFSRAMDALGGQVDILINAAGIQRRYAAAEFPLDCWNSMMEINLTAVFELCKMAGACMLRQGKGKIINIASMLSFFGGYRVPAYAASKGGVAQLTKALSNEWAGRGINVNAIAPGYMDTEMNTALRNDAARNETILARIPAGRWGTPDDVKGVAVFLSSSASDYISGAVIPVDGGYLGA